MALSKLIRSLIAVAVAICVACVTIQTSLGATVLTFDPVGTGSITAGNSILEDAGGFVGEDLRLNEPGYGSRVTGINSDGNLVPYQYGTADGFTPAGVFTPNIVPVWGTQILAGNNETQWDLFGDLDNTIIPFIPDVFTLNADPGVAAVLESFDVAARSSFAPGTDLRWLATVDGFYFSAGQVNNISNVGHTTIHLDTAGDGTGDFPAGSSIQLFLLPGNFDGVGSYPGLTALGFDNIQFSQADSSIVPTQPTPSIWTGASSTDWATATNWNGPLPNAPGASAAIVSSNAPALSSATTIGSMQFVQNQISVPSNQTMGVSGSEILTFDEPGVEPARIVVRPVSTINATISTPVSIAPGETLQISVPTNGPLNMSGPIVSPVGDLVKIGAGVLTLAGDNSAWGGNLTIEAGEVFASNSNSLGDATGDTTITGGATLRIQSNSQESLRADSGRLKLADRASGSTLIQYSGNIELIGDGFLMDVGNRTTLNLTGSISSGPSVQGNLRKLGAGRLTLASDNPSWNGSLLVEAGELFVDSPLALGSATTGSTITGGNLRLNVNTTEPIRVEGGQLNVYASETGTITMAGGVSWLRANNSIPIVLDSGLSTVNGSNTSWSGGTTGVGSVTLGGSIKIDAPLSHVGNAVFLDSVLNVGNTYNGTTRIGGSAVVNHPMAFGTSTTPIHIGSGNMILNVIPSGDRNFIVERGTITVQTDEQPITGDVTLGIDWATEINGIGVFEGAIAYTSVPGGGYATIGGGTFNGTIEGVSELILGSGSQNVILNSANNILGRTRIGRGVVVVNHESALNQKTTQIESGVLELNVPAVTSPWLTGSSSSSSEATIRLNVDQSIDEPWMINTGIVEPRANVTFDRLLLLGVNGQATVHATDGGAAIINGELISLGDSALDGKISGSGAIRTIIGSTNIRGDLTGFDGTISVKNGSLTLGQYFVSGSGGEVELNPDIEFHVYPNSHLTIYTRDLTVENDIFLHDAHGPDSAPALRYFGNSGRRTLAGRIHVGDQGSIITGRFTVTGTFQGSNLTITDSELSLLSPQTELAGTLRLLRGGALSIDQNASVHNLTEILLDDGSLLLRASRVSDRIDDNTIIRSNGGSVVSYFSSFVTPTTERLGALSLEHGRTVLQGWSQTPGSTPLLVFEQLHRDPGALLRFSLHSGEGGVGFVNLPELQDGMIGAWATTDNGFATIGANGTFRTLQGTASDINAAGPNDHVVVPGILSLTADRTIASLNNPATGSPYWFDLQGHQLTVRSGGIFESGNIINGTLTAGDGLPVELIAYGVPRISADITDNGPNGVVSLLSATNWTLALDGANTYTGGTWISQGTLAIKDLAAIPENDRVYIDGGTYDLLDLQSGIVKLQELHMRGSGKVSGFNAPIDADRYYLESGLVNAPLTGDGVIYKDSEAGVLFSPNSKGPGFIGDVYVRNGSLGVDRDTLPNATYYVQGGQLRGGGEYRLLPSSIVLQGGQLEGWFSGPIEVTEDSSLFAGSLTLLYGKLSGDGDLTVESTFDSSFINRYVGIFGDSSEYTGDFHVETGALRIGAPAVVGPGVVNVQAGARLILGSNYPDDGPTYLNRDVHLYGGTLYATPPQSFPGNQIPPGVATGDVYVHREAFIGSRREGEDTEDNRIPGLELAGRLILDDGARVYGLSNSGNGFYTGKQPLLDISGELVVRTNNHWQLGTASLQITGTIRPDAIESSIDFQGISTSLVLSKASIHTVAQRNLQVTLNGERFVIELEDPSSQVTGDGTYIGDLSLTGGATLAPGNSPGTLTIAGGLSVGNGAMYEWELANPVGSAGLDWDYLVVNDLLSFTAMPENPWIIKVGELGDIPTVSSEWLIASATAIEGFDPTAALVDISGLSNPFFQSRAAHFSVKQRESQLYLNLTVHDLNNDGVVNTLDIDPFVLLLTDPAGYAAAFPGVDPLAVGDINHDLAINTLDIDPFITMLTSGSLSSGAVPEPGTITLALLAAVSLFGLRKNL